MTKQILLIYFPINCTGCPRKNAGYMYLIWVKFGSELILCLVFFLENRFAKSYGILLILLAVKSDSGIVD